MQQAIKLCLVLALLALESYTLAVRYTPVETPTRFVVLNYLLRNGKSLSTR